MVLHRSLVFVSTLAFFVSTAPAALAQNRGGSRSGGGGSRGSSAPRSASPRSSAPRASAPSRSYTPRASTPSGPRAASPSRSYSYGPYNATRGGAVVGRGYSRPNVYGYGGRSYGYGGYGYRGYAYSPIRFIRPYYSFRPRFSIGFGLWVGFPIAYSYPYYYPSYYPYYPYYDPYAYPYAPPYANAYPPTYGSGYPTTADPGYYGQASPPQSSGTVGVQQIPSNQNSGGVSFEISPSDAEVFVDGNAVGTVGQFTPSSQPLGLSVGRHRIEIRAPGYQTISFEADIVAGQVIPYQGTLQR